VARRGAVLYFVLAELASMDVMYQYSLAWFLHMFGSCISAPPAEDDDISSIESSATATHQSSAPSSVRRASIPLGDSDFDDSDFERSR
jgi:hypothetical protein